MSELLQCGARADVKALAARDRIRKAGNEGMRGPAALGCRGPSSSRAPDVAGAEAAVGILQKQFPNIVVPRVGKDITYEEWFWKEMREGGVLQRYLEQEKSERVTRGRYRKVAKAMDGFQQNNKSDFQLKAAVPLRDYFRWKATDEHFFEDDKNLRSLKRDNPDVVVRC